MRYIKGKKYCRSLTGLRPDSNSESPTVPFSLLVNVLIVFTAGRAGMLRCADMRSFRRATKDLCNLFLPVLFGSLKTCHDTAPFEAARHTCLKIEGNIAQIMRGQTGAERQLLAALAGAATCCWRIFPARARPRWPRRWPARSTRSSSASSSRPTCCRPTFWASRS